MRYSLFLFFLAFFQYSGFSQTTDQLEIIQGRIKSLNFEEEDQVVYLLKNKNGQATVRQKETIIEADEIKTLTKPNIAEAKNNVYINHADSIDIYSKTAVYYGNSKRAVLKDEVVLKQGVYTILTDELEYDMNSSIATYTKGGQLSDSTSVLTSIYGEFNTNTEIANFKEDVVLRTKDRQIETENLIYHSQDKWAYFKGATTITERDGRVIQTNDGKYNTETGEAVMNNQPVIEDTETIFKADSILKDKDDVTTATGDVSYYNKQDQFSLKAQQAKRFSEEHIKATGNVEYFDELKQVTFTAEEVERFKENVIKARGNVHYRDELKQQEFTAQEAEQLGENHYKAKGNIKYTDRLEQLTFLANQAEQFAKDSLIASGNVFIQDDKNFLIVQAEQVQQFNSDKITLRNNVDITNTKDSINIIAQKANVFQESEIFEAFEDVKVTRLNDSTTLLTDSLYFNQKTGRGFAKGRPFLESEDNGEKLFMIAKELKAIRQNNLDSTYNFIADREVKIYKSNLQAVADSAHVNSKDSIITLTKRPVVWLDSIQMSADTIRIKLSEGEINKVEFRKNCYFASPVADELFNQMRGRQMDVNFENGDISTLFVDGNAETIFMVQDSENAFVGVDEMKSGQIKVEFEEGKIDEIYWLKQQEGTTYPFQEIDPTTKRFPNFNWRGLERPTSKEYMLIASGRKEGAILNQKLESDSLIKEMINNQGNDGMNRNLEEDEPAIIRNPKKKATRKPRKDD